MKKLIYTLLIIVGLVGCKKDEFTLGTQVDDFFFLKNKGAHLPIWVEGNAASKIFLIHVHGGPGGESMASFNVLGKGFTDPLEEKYANVYYDQRGSGSAQGNPKSETFTEEQFAEDLYKVIKLLKAKYSDDIKVFLIGTSWGGRLCASYLINPVYQDEVQGWASVSGAVNNVKTANEGRELLLKYADVYINEGKDIEQWTEIKDWALSVDSVETEEQWGDQNSFGWDAMGLVDDSLSHESKIEFKKVVKSIFFSPSHLSSILVHSSSFPEKKLTVFNDLTDELSSITIPSLFMAGKFDFVVAPEAVYSSYEQISSTQKQWVLFEKSAHAIPFNETEKFLDELISFIENNQ